MPTVPIPALDDEGREIPDPTPIVIHLRTGPVTDFDRVRRMIREEMSAAADAAGMETLDEANDFEVEDDLFPVSKHEYDEETEAADLEALQAEQERQRKKKAKKTEPSSGTPDEGAGSEGSSPSSSPSPASPPAS